MMRAIKRIPTSRFIVVLATTSLILVATATAQHGAVKYTDDLNHRLSLAPADFVEHVWVYLDSSAADPAGVHLSEENRRRRAKVDPVGLLIDHLDYPVRASVIDSIAATGATIRQVSRWLRAVSVEADEAALREVAALTCVERLDVVRTLVAHWSELEAKVDREAPRPTALDLSYGRSEGQLQFMDAVILHQLGLTGRGVRVAIFDTGFDLDHHAFDFLNVVARHDFINGGETVDSADCPLEPSSRHQTRHGTLILGTLAAFVPDTMIGAAYNADYLLAKTEITCGGTEIRLEEDNWLAAAEWADSLGADLITSSLGYSRFDDSTGYELSDLDGNTALVTRAADWAASKNIVVVSSAGNERGTSWDQITTPADGDSVLAVGATFADSTVTTFSSPGPTADGRIKPDVATLGSLNWTTGPDDEFTLASGTSLAAPLVAGGLALALENDTLITAAELLQLARRTAGQASSPDNDLGYGTFSASRTANIVRIDIPGLLVVGVGDTAELDISTHGQIVDTPIVAAIDLPHSASIVDNGDGSARLTVTGHADMAISTMVSIIADVGYYADTVRLEVLVDAERVEPIYAGPNPFVDSVRFFVDDVVGGATSVSIFTLAGELVWDRVNNSAVSADDITWYGTNRDGREVASGLYIALVRAGQSSARIKLLKIE